MLGYTALCGGSLLRPDVVSKPWRIRSGICAFDCCRTYNNEERGASLADCRACSEGKDCSASGTDEPKDCPISHYCPAGSTRTIACPIGTFRWGIFKILLVQALQISENQNNLS